MNRLKRLLRETEMQDMNTVSAYMFVKSENISFSMNPNTKTNTGGMEEIVYRRREGGEPVIRKRRERREDAKEKEENERVYLI